MNIKTLTRPVLANLGVVGCLTLLLPLALNAMQEPNTRHCDQSGDVELTSRAIPEIVDNAGKALTKAEYSRSNYLVKLGTCIKDPATRMNSIEYTVTTVDTNEVLASGIAEAPFNAACALHRLNAQALLRITFFNK